MEITQQGITLNITLSFFSLLLVLLVIFVFLGLVTLIFKKLLSLRRDIFKARRSADVKSGLLTETLAPLLDQFPIDIKKPQTTTIFLGKPVDYIHFDPEYGIVFVEIKSGRAKLSQTQRRIKQLIKERRVYWEELRLIK